ncbi:phosphatase PAP2 family protein [Coxiella burnetii]|uniref:phosphatase PAP2 family protein n=1 Tax=Coxiella burnetii TaxID=777 RepID=UPI000183CECB|nr:phosphatase PAP2 family protein [Coxiella burnetii]ACJ17537.1 phosphoesterase, PAP2 family [Coxiella burnetii CbuG_Q212]OYK87114.1 phosphatase PAP2 family protein [Coxiella burnetii]
MLIIFSYFFIDRQLVWFLVEHQSRRFKILALFANGITSFIAIFIFLYYIIFFIKFSVSSLKEFDKKLIIVCNSVVISAFIKDIVKIIFGRYWTATFNCNNPSLISNHVYGFNWLKSGNAYGSFPSGHTVFIFSFSVSLWILFPRLRWLWSMLAFCVIFGQIGIYYHFVSDVIAGVTLGSWIGLYNTFYSLESKRLLTYL